MLDQLRAMGVFACVVENNSFSGAARELGITTSAVSQQIRSLEQEMEVVLLHRSTRKLSLTEAGQAFFHSCQEMLSAAERGKTRINELRDDLVGDLRIAATPELYTNHVIPALSNWMSAHRGLSVHLEADNQYIDLLEGRIDIALRLSSTIEDQNIHAIPLVHVDQILVAAPSYINQSTHISRPEDLKQHDLIPMNTVKNFQQVAVQHSSGESAYIDMPARLSTNNTLVAKSLCLQGHGITRIFYLDAKQDLLNGALIEVLPDWKLPKLTLYAVMNKLEQQPMKVSRCVDALKNYFAHLQSNRLHSDTAK
jgi:DNA-binding transcriptional LysR family regulator